MDLGSCPKCAANWVKGDERCRQCGYTAIGAGLSRLPKKKKRKVRAYVEPGNSTPLLSFTLVVILLWGGYYYRPWTEDWDFVRSMFGAGRHHPLKGNWEITETLNVKGEDSNAFTKLQVATGSFSFDGSEDVKVVITNSSGTATAKGHYLVDATKVTLFGLTASGDSTTSIPKELKLTIAWTGPDAFVAAVSEQDTIFVRRKDGSDELKKMAHMVMSKNVEEAPDSVRGLISTIQKSAGGGEN